ncbi:MAG: PduL/EutD family phosphate acyltransferase [Candidatus Falkowbacteria bacterium]
MIIVPIEISSRHVHLSQEDLDVLFDLDYKLAPLKNISQTGQYAAQETVTLKNGNSEIKNVRIIGPVRQSTVVELAASDSRKLGLKLAVNNSVTIIGPNNSLTRDCAVIPQRHIHASNEDAKKYKLHDKQIVSVECGQKRKVIFANVIVRVDQDFVWNFHVDIDEANAAGLAENEFGTVIV